MLDILNHRMKNSSIRFKLVAMMSLSCLVGIILCCCGFIFNDMKTLRSAKARQITAQAEMLAFNSSAVIAFMQQEAGEELLSAFTAEPTIERSALYSVDGDIIACYPPQPSELLPDSTKLIDGTVQDQDGNLHHVSAVMDSGERVGSLYVASNMNDVADQIRAYIKIAILMSGLSLAVAVLFAIYMQGFLSRPVVKLAEVAVQIREQEDYSVRVFAERNDELGTLYSAFNAMLAQIDESKNALRMANDHLEDRVTERTAQLQKEIAEREKTRQQLITAKEEAEHANIAKSMFLANMSHEIRTPMNAILGFTEILRRQGEEADSEERNDYLETIHRSGQHLLGLINDILDLSKIEANRMELDIVEESPHQIIAEAISVMRVPALQKGLTLDYSWNGPVPSAVQTDPSRLRQLLINLIGNAIKFTRHGGVKVNVELTDLDTEPCLRLEVLDTGIGIPKQKLAEIFKPFSQADVSTTREFGGTGLGLTISRRIAEALGGRLEVCSEPGQGSVFAVVVPVGKLETLELRSSPPIADIVLNRDTANFDEQLPIIDGASILLVEDGVTNRRMVKLILKSHNVTVTEAENGEIGVELASNRDFDIILMDMQMPVKDGYTATAELRQKGLQTPIIALTAHAMKGDREKCMSAGCTDYLTKPITEERLIKSLCKYLPVKPASLPTTCVTQEVSPPVTNKTLPTADDDNDANESVATEPVLSALPYDDPDYREIIEDFQRELAQKLAEMNKCLERSDFEALAVLAHWLKGTAGTAGFDHFTIPAIRLERHACSNSANDVNTALDVIISLAERLQSTSEAAANGEANLEKPATKV